LPFREDTQEITFHPFSEKIFIYYQVHIPLANLFISDRIDNRKVVKNLMEVKK
jgi:hypothetical protein